ncbi:MAG TPA: hypothetical protein VFY45_14540 [Baekduia sp.]|nr:hypothetical protein [Baekduia sp.]
MGRGALASAAAVLLAVALAPVASAAWLSAETISPVAQSASYPAVATGAAGDAVASWSADTDGLQVSDRPAGGPWTAPTALSTAGAQVSSRQVVIDASGTITAVWGEYTEDTSDPMNPMMGPTTIFTARRQPPAARRPTGANWSTPQQLSTTNVDAGSAGLAVGSGGRVAAVWVETGALRSATRTAAGAWRAADTVAPSGASNAVPLVAVDADGTVTAAWQSDTDSVRSATQADGGPWSTPVDVSTGFSVLPALGMDANGDATLVWLGVVAGTQKIFSARRAAATGPWSAPTQISVTTGTSLYTPVVAVDTEGRATAAWAQFMTVGTVRYDQNVATRAADGTWGTPVALGVGSSDPPSVSARSAGDVTVAWRGIVGGCCVVQSSSHAPAATGRPRQSSRVWATATPPSASTTRATP